MRISDWSSDVCSSYRGINWGSVSVDSVHRRMIVNLQTAPFTIKLVPRAQYKGAMNGGDLVAVGPQEGTPYVVVRGPFLSPLKTPCVAPPWGKLVRSEEHTSELQSLMRNSYAVFCLKKKNITQ